jgi:FAD/FMN-containing dehydrogenase
MEFYWFPHTDRVLTKRNDRVAAGEPGKPLGRLKGWVDDELLSNKVFELTNRVTRRLPGAIPRVNRLAAGALSSREFTAPSCDVFCSPRSVRFVESEWALPREALPQVVREIDAFVRRAGLRVSFPVEVRVAAADDVWLSTAHERPSAYVAVHMYRGTPFEEYFRGVEDIAVAAGGRPHWGKLHTRTADQLREVYPRFADFVALRDQLDPQRVFANDYLDRVLGA